MEDGRLPRRSEDPNKQRKKKTLRFKIVLFVLLHITILGYQLSNVISDKEKDAVVSTTEGLRKVRLLHTHTHDTDAHSDTRFSPLVPCAGLSQKEVGA